jgi:hypothetical protein
MEKTAAHAHSLDPTTCPDPNNLDRDQKTFALTSDRFLVGIMPTNEEPNDDAIALYSERSMIAIDVRRPVRPNAFEMQRRMPMILQP